MTGSASEAGRFGLLHLLSVRPSMLVMIVGAILALLLVLPGVTVTTRSLNELFILFDGIYRVVEGHVPGLDFRTSVGPLAFYLPAAGYLLTESLGSAIPFAMAVIVALVTLVSSHVLASRLHPFLGVSFAAFLLLILAVPMNLGDGVTALSFAMFYNRVGWVSLALLLVMYLRPLTRSTRQAMLDAASATALTLLAISMRGTFGFGAIAILVFLVTVTRQWAWGLPALGLSIAMVGISLLTLGGAYGYLKESSGEVAWLVAGAWEGQRLLELAIGHLADLLLVGAIVALLAWWGRGLRHVPFFLFCAILGLILLSGNVQRWGIITLHAAAVVAGEHLLRSIDAAPQRQGAVVNSAGVKLFVLALLLPTIVHCVIALTLHAGVAAAREGESVALPGLEDVRLVDLWTSGDFNGGRAYVATAQEGLVLIGDPEQPRRLVVLGSADIFSAILGLEPSDPELPAPMPPALAERAIGGLPQERLAEADLVLVRKRGERLDAAATPYLSQLQENFRQAAESSQWALFAREHGEDGVDP